METINVNGDGKFSPEVNAIAEQTRQAIFGKNYKLSEEEIGEIEDKKYMEIGENFMNELYVLAKDFTPLYEKGKKVVYFDVEEKDGVLQKIAFWDKRKDYSGNKESPRHYHSLAGVEILRGTGGYFFSLSTYEPLYTTISAGSGYVNHNRDETRTTSLLGFSGVNIEGAHDISSLLEVIKKRVAEAKGEVYIPERSRDTVAKLGDVFSQSPVKKKNKKN